MTETLTLLVAEPDNELRDELVGQLLTEGYHTRPHSGQGAPVIERETANVKRRLPALGRDEPRTQGTTP
jgi:hypothetical protein